MIHKNQKSTDRTNAHYRIWKKGKKWCYSFSVLAALAGGIHMASATVNADTGSAKIVCAADNGVIQQKEVETETTVKIHYVDLKGNLIKGTSMVTQSGAPTGKDDASGNRNSGSAAVNPIDIPGYTLMKEDYSNLTKDQRNQLEDTLVNSLGYYAAALNYTEYRTIIATKSLNVPYPGFDNVYYKLDGSIGDSNDVGTGVFGYGSTDVYYFYIGNSQKVVYNVIDDTSGKNIENNADFDEGATGDNLSRSQQDLQDIADSYVSKGYDVTSVDTLPATFDNVDDPNRSASQIVNIHLKHATQDSTENKEIGETIHYFYENGDKAAEDYIGNVTFTRTVMTDKVTNEKVYGEWASDDTTFDAVTSPTIDGYTADKLSVEAIEGLTADSANTEVTVTYKKDAEEPTPTPEPTDETPTTPSSTPKATVTVQPTNQTAKKSVLPSTGDEARSTAAAAGGLIVLGAGLLGVIRYLRRKKQ